MELDLFHCSGNSIRHFSMFSFRSDRKQLRIAFFRETLLEIISSDRGFKLSWNKLAAGVSEENLRNNNSYQWKLPWERCGVENPPSRSTNNEPRIIFNSHAITNVCLFHLRFYLGTDTALVNHLFLSLHYLSHKNEFLTKLDQQRNDKKQPTLQHNLCILISITFINIASHKYSTTYTGLSWKEGRKKRR